MDKAYADTVRLLLGVAPAVFDNEIFAMKGGTAINLFVRDMPRLSVDIDVVYTPWQVARDAALTAISDELDSVMQRLARLGLQVRKVIAKDQSETKLLVEDANSLVKVEVNIVFRGTVMAIERRPLCAKASDMFSMEMDLPMLSKAELYGGKLVAALDRQHPRDLFDALQMLQADGLSEDTVECFVTYLAGHNRPTHEVLFGSDKDIANEYHNNFVGMTTESVSLESLLDVRAQLREELPRRLSANQRQFLSGLVSAKPDWTLLQCPHASELPALRWKLANLETFQLKRPADFHSQASTLMTKLQAL